MFGWGLFTNVRLHTYVSMQMIDFLSLRWCTPSNSVKYCNLSGNLKYLHLLTLVDAIALKTLCRLTQFGYSRVATVAMMLELNRIKNTLIHKMCPAIPLILKFITQADIRLGYQDKGNLIKFVFYLLVLSG